MLGFIQMTSFYWNNTYASCTLCSRLRDPWHGEDPWPRSSTDSLLSRSHSHRLLLLSSQRYHPEGTALPLCSWPLTLQDPRYLRCFPHQCMPISTSTTHLLVFGADVLVYLLVCCFNENNSNWPQTQTETRLQPLLLASEANASCLKGGTPLVGWKSMRKYFDFCSFPRESQVLASPSP